MENGKVQPRKMASEAFVLALTSHIRKRSVHQRMHELSPDASPIVDQHVFHEAESQERSWPRWDIQIVVSGRCVTHEWDIVRDTSTFVLYDQFQ